MAVHHDATIAPTKPRASAGLGAAPAVGCRRGRVAGHRHDAHHRGRSLGLRRCHDPVYVSALATTILTGGREADLFLATPGGLVPQPASARVRGTGAPSREVEDPVLPAVVG